jgi:iron complex transport system substrate-binding protein
MRVQVNERFLCMSHQRIVSLIPSGTEIVTALGLGPQLVGRSHECDYPADVQKLPAVTAPKIDISGSSRIVHADVSDIIQNALSVFSVDEDLLRALRPTVILTQTHCEVCAVSYADVERAILHSLDKRTKIVALEPNTLDDIWQDVLRASDTLGVPERGDMLVTNLKSRMKIIADRGQTAAKKGRPRVACIEWIDPLMASGNWMPELVSMAGGESIFGEAGRHLNWDDVLQADPDVIIVMPCGYDIDRSFDELALLMDRPEWPSLRAVQNHQVYVVDGNQFFNRPGPRLGESLEILAEILHPDAFHFGHFGKGWERVTSVL